MNKIFGIALAIFFVSTLPAFSEDATGEHKSPHWTYEGETGPEYWGSIDPSFSACQNGVNQSPINVTKATSALLGDIIFNYNDVPLSLINNGHTIQLNYAPGSSITVNGQTFNVLQFHFHSPSENNIDGMSYPLEMHIVHKDKNGKLGVIAVMFKEGRENPVITGLWSHLKEATVGKTVNKDDISINVYAMLPANKEYYRFNGSLTTPPCSEGVQWMLMKTPLEVSPEQITQFVNLIGHNNRPIQALNARVILK